MHYFSGKGCSESLESMHYCIGILKTLGEVLKQHRLNCKMTQEFVAETLGVSRQAVSKWESGASAPSTTNLMALAKVFDVSAEELLKETQKN